MILQICGKQLHRSVICGAHDFQCVWAVDIVLAVTEWQHSSSLSWLFARPSKGAPPPCSTLPKVCEDCESGPADVLNVIASKPDLRQHAYYEGLRLFRAVFSNLAIRSRPSAVLMRSLASDSHVAAMFRSICRCSGDLDWFAKPRHSLVCCRYCETLRIPPDFC